MSLPQDERRLESPMREISGIRHELVNRIREEIRAGTYDDPAKWEAALERMFSHLSRD